MKKSTAIINAFINKELSQQEYNFIHEVVDGKHSGLNAWTITDCMSVETAAEELKAAGKAATETYQHLMNAVD